MRAIFLAVMSLMLSFSPAWAQTAEEEGETGNNLPRFVSLRSSLVNARSGPGARYPIEWVYMQRAAPVEVIAEFELWRKIKDWQGSESWVHKAMLSSAKRNVKVIAPGENNILAKPEYNSKVIARVENEVVGEVIKCPEGIAFCHVKFDSIDGWISRQNLYGIYPKETIN